MHKKQIDIFSIRKGISNKSLAIFILLVMLASSVWLYLKFLAPASRQDWLKIQSQYLGNVFGGINSQSDTAEFVAAKYAIIPVLMYHHVGPLPEKANNLRKDMTVSNDDFELQAAWLKGQGFESIKLGDLLKYKQGKFKLPDKPVIFTFDDGYKDVFDNAVPILKKYGFTGDFAVITQFAGITQGTNQYASWQQIKQAQKDGMEIVSHTQDHFDGTSPKYDTAFILRNLTDSRSDLQHNLGTNSDILVYPFGHYNQQYIKLAKQAGFNMGLTTKFGEKINMYDLMQVSRVRVHGNEDLEQFKRNILAGEKASGNNDY